jgi:hypothetical protein
VIVQGSTRSELKTHLIAHTVYVVSNLPEATTYTTWNHTLLPANTLVLGAGFAIVNQTTLPSYQYDRVSLGEVSQDD